MQIFLQIMTYSISHVSLCVCARLSLKWRAKLVEEEEKQIQCEKIVAWIK